MDCTFRGKARGRTGFLPGQRGDFQGVLGKPCSRLGEFLRSDRQTSCSPPPPLALDYVHFFIYDAHSARPFEHRLLRQQMRFARPRHFAVVSGCECVLGGTSRLLEPTKPSRCVHSSMCRTPTVLVMGKRLKIHGFPESLPSTR